MKKSSLLIISFAVVITCLICFVACSLENENGETSSNLQHQHSYVKTIVEPTCTMQGYTIFKCDCGDWRKEDFKAKLGHHLQTIHEDATCEKAGFHKEYCLRENCDYIVETIIESTGHNFGEYLNDHNATCTHNGTQTAVCKSCGVKDIKEIPNSKLEHSFGEWKVLISPTCTVTGNRERECTSCHFVQSEQINALGHTATVWNTIIEPTCTTDGEKVAKCQRCGLENAKMPIPKLGHNYGAYITTKEPTCIADGEKQRTCSRCSDIQKEVLNKIGHNWSGWNTTMSPSCTQQGRQERVCGICGQSEKKVLPMTDHIESGWIVDRVASTTQEGLRHTECTICKKTIRTETLPKLDGMQATYRIYIRDYDGISYIPYGWRKVAIYDTTWALRGEGWEYGKDAPIGEPNNDGYVDFVLPTGTYYVKILQIIDGYEVDEYYIITADMGTYPYQDEKDYPTLKIVLNRNLKQGPSPENNEYSNGSTLYDFEDVAYTYENGQVTTNPFVLSQLLSTKKVVLINFFFNNCPYCIEELPYFESFYEKYKNDVAIIMIDDTTRGGKAYDFCNNYRLPFYLLDDNGYIKQYTKNFITGYPTTLVIDQRGMIRTHLGAIKSEQVLINAVKEYLGNFPTGDQTHAENIIKPTRDILPTKENELYEKI